LRRQALLMDRIWAAPCSTLHRREPGHFPDGGGECRIDRGARPGHGQPSQSVCLSANNGQIREARH
jgi:hypothetical protein